MTKEFKLSQETQKAIAFAALRNYANFLRHNNNRKGLNELRYMLNGFSDSLRSQGNNSRS